MRGDAVLDSVNRNTMRVSVREYPPTGTCEAERVAFSSVREEFRNKRILDIGVGGGRSVKILREISEDYLGIDYVQEMVDQSRRLFPGVRFELADARSMPQFSGESFDLIVFTSNGISMVDHEGRLAILKEVRRLLKPGGAFIFSTYNQKSARHTALFYLPPFEPTSNPAKMLVRGVRFVLHIAYQIVNRIRFRRLEVRTDQYSIINDKCHLYRTLLYYITLDNQRKQLEATGFRPNAAVYDTSGREIRSDTLDDSMMFVVRG